MAGTTPQDDVWLPPVLRHLRTHRLLAIVLAVSVAMGMWEWIHELTPTNLYFDTPQSFTDVVGELYPDSAGVQHLRSQQLTLCMQTILEGRTPPEPCRQFAGKNPVQQVRQFFERGIATSKHIEDLYYEYLVFLTLTSSDQQEIDVAYEQWRRKFPLSGRPDPRR